jgi:DNA-binding NarL/FixJ family response regulator
MTAQSKERRRRMEADLRRRAVAALVLHQMQRALELWDEGLSRAEIAERLGICTRTLYNRLHALGRVDERGRHPHEEGANADG